MRYRMYYITVLLQLYYVITLCAKPIHNDYYEYTFWVVRLNYSSYTFLTGLAAGISRRVAMADRTPGWPRASSSGCHAQVSTVALASSTSPPLPTRHSHHTTPHHVHTTPHHVRVPPSNQLPLVSEASGPPPYGALLSCVCRVCDWSVSRRHHCKGQCLFSRLLGWPPFRWAHPPCQVRELRAGGGLGFPVLL